MQKQEIKSVGLHYNAETRRRRHRLWTYTKNRSEKPQKGGAARMALEDC
jgi:hypothetical protein